MNFAWAGAHGRFNEIPFRRVFEQVRRPVPRDPQIVTAYTNGDVTLRSNRRIDGYHEAADFSGFQGVEEGDFVVHGLDILRGSVGVSDSNGAISSVCIVCRPRGSDDPRFFAYVMRAQAFSGFPRAMARGIREGGADFRRWDTLAELPLPRPSSAVQRVIADFLDAETAGIDALITKKRLLSDVLQFRFIHQVRKAVLLGQHYDDPLAVTPKDTTASVQAAKLSWLADFGGGTTPDTGVAMYYDGSIPWVLTGDLTDADLFTATRTVSPNAMRDYSALKLHESGSLVLAMYGATIGKMSILRTRATVNQACCVITPGPRLDTEFLFYYLLGFRAELIERGRGSGQPNISQEAVRSLRLPVPAMQTQLKVVEHLSEKRQKTLLLLSQLNEQITLLQERRLALITAAVTGQIDNPRAVA